MSAIDKVVDWFKVYSRKREKYTERDGFLSYAGEFHALFIGLGVGFLGAVRQQPELLAGFVAVVLGIGTVSEFQTMLKKALSGVGKAAEKASAIGEVRREPWYALGGAYGSFVPFWIAMHGPESLQKALIDSLDVMTDILAAVV